jgi:hypothetical protein
VKPLFRLPVRPFAPVTDTVLVPKVALEAIVIVAVMWLSSTTTTLVTVIPAPKLTEVEAAPVNPIPVITTSYE